MTDIFQMSNHRPWPMPNSKWLMRQQWHDLLFCHWPVPVEKLRPHIPEILKIQEFNGSAWIGIIPFTMTGVTLRYMPDFPPLTSFPELNVRTYVEYKGRPGVWFFSLDAANPLAVWGARIFFHLPYFQAKMKWRWRNGWMEYSSKRESEKKRFLTRYRPKGELYQPGIQSFEHWFVERYCLYTTNKSGRLIRCEIHHPPWKLYSAIADLRINNMAEIIDDGFDALPGKFHFAKNQKVVVWKPEFCS